MPDLIDDYLELGLALGRHIDGMVDAYYGPPELAARVAAEPIRPPVELEARGRRLLADLVADTALDGARRQFLIAQVKGLRTTAAKLAGQAIGYADEVEACYGVRPEMVPEDTFAAAHRRLDEVLPGSGPLAERYVSWREAQAVPADKLRPAVDSLAEDLRARTRALFGLPDDERVDFDLVTNQPWAGFNYYLGNLRSRVVINVDLPVLSTSLGHLVAHEAYPGHHTEHCRKEVGLVRRRRHLEETIFLVGTPQCLLAEGLADLGLEVVAGRRPEPFVAEHLRAPRASRTTPTWSPSCPPPASRSARSGATPPCCCTSEGADGDTVVDYLARWSLLSRPRATKAVQFLTDPTWRAYIYCYISGVDLCRRFVAGDPARFARLISEQLTPADLGAAA